MSCSNPLLLRYKFTRSPTRYVPFPKRLAFKPGACAQRRRDRLSPTHPSATWHHCREGSVSAVRGLGDSSLAQKHGGAREETSRRSRIPLFFFRQTGTQERFHTYALGAEIPCQMIPVGLTKSSLTTGEERFLFCLTREGNVSVRVWRSPWHQSPRHKTVWNISEYIARAGAEQRGRVIPGGLIRSISRSAAVSCSRLISVKNSNILFYCQSEVTDVQVWHEPLPPDKNNMTDPLSKENAL